MIGHISFDLKVLGERSAGNPHATFDVAGVGNGKQGQKKIHASPRQFSTLPEEGLAGEIRPVYSPRINLNVTI